MTWFFNVFLHWVSRTVVRYCSVSTCSVVPTKMMRNSTRAGVTKITLISRADWVTGVMSP